MQDCMGFGCEQCQLGVDGTGARVRAKSPLVNSAERDRKCHRVDINTPLAPVPTFSTIIPKDNGKTTKGKGWRWEKGKRKGGKNGKTHGVRGMEERTHGMEMMGGMAVEVIAERGKNDL